MGRRIGNGADLSAGPMWELVRRKKKKKTKGRDYKDVVVPHVTHTHTHSDTHSLNLSLPLSHHLSMICLIPSKTVEVKKPAFRKTALWSSSGCAAQSIRQGEHWSFWFDEECCGRHCLSLLKYESRRVVASEGGTAPGPIRRQLTEGKPRKTIFGCRIILYGRILD